MSEASDAGNLEKHQPSIITAEIDSIRQGAVLLTGRSQSAWTLCWDYDTI